MNEIWKFGFRFDDALQHPFAFEKRRAYKRSPSANFSTTITDDLSALGNHFIKGEGLERELSSSDR